MKITTSKLIRWSGLAAMVTGFLYMAIQAVHPLDIPASVTTSRWVLVHYVSLVMDLLGLLAVTGIYARQAEKAGWLGLAGYLLFGLFWALDVAFHFIEAFVEPVLATQAPQFVAGLLGMVTNTPSQVNLGAIPTIYSLDGVAGYVLGGLLFGIATFRAGVLPRWAGGLLALGAILPLVLSSLVHHPYDRLFALPVGLALLWMGWALWSERRAEAMPAKR